MARGPISGQVIGDKKLIRNLRRLEGETQVAARAVILKVANDIRNEIVKSMSQGVKTGITYTRRRNGRVIKHTASAKGESPATDTGTLVKQIKVVDDGALTAAVGTRVKYGKDLEFGTRNVDERPWLWPAVERNRKELMDKLGAAMRGELRNAVKRGPK